MATALPSARKGGLLQVGDMLAFLADVIRASRFFFVIFEERTETNLKA
ncbi:hypothetical protein FM107_02640 [Sphingobacterium sp. JB170]|nr:hypothetical protein FM107_02640 [Sphingobacterium sp. JB170]